MHSLWTIKTPEGDLDFATPQEAAEYVKARLRPSEAASTGLHNDGSLDKMANKSEVKAMGIAAGKNAISASRTPVSDQSVPLGLDQFDFLKFTIVELDEIIAKATDAKRSFYHRRRAELLAELEALDAQENAATPPPIERRRKKETRPRKIKLFQDEEGNFWRGVGRKPSWLEDRLKAGAKLEDFLVESLSIQKLHR